ncbi:MAG: hypothetical protein J7604_15195 [Sporocytophaga sp.]|uniref:hypothetical protein n=1 Tax=Sporocytophaga sp. TaxID=2231183 RepID=UPI001B0146A3|nr:hypothetical protein [Sporocytophaga sp.]MBO9701553.1 hypothetical protein [Sporocytophaga sp.]
MKKKSFILLVGLAFSLLISCGKKNDPKPSSSSGPTMELVKSKGSVTVDTTVKPGTTIKIVFLAKKGSSDLKAISIKEDGTPTSDPYNFLPDLNMLNKVSPILDSVTFTSTTSTSGTKTFSFTVTAANGDVATKSVKVTYFDAVTSTTKQDVVSLNDSTANHSSFPVGGFYSLSRKPLNFTGSYLESEAGSYASYIDFCYIHNYTTYEQFLAAPSDEASKEVYPSLKNWSVTNATKFVETTLTVDQYKNATGSDIEAFAKEAGVENGSTKILLRKNNGVRYIYAMKTASGKYALIDPYFFDTSQGIAINVKMVK